MKSISMTLIAMTVLTGVHSWKEQPLESLQDGGRDLSHIQESPYFQLVSDDASPESGCLIVVRSNPRPRQKLLLGSCDLPDQGWRYDSDTKLFHTMLKDDMCMQAGLGGTPGHGTKMRLFPCDEDEELQKFDYGNTIELVGANLCVIFQGIHSNVNVDEIKLKPCDISDGQDDWSQDAPVNGE
jgi:hypothetical protein